MLYSQKWTSGYCSTAALFPAVLYELYQHDRGRFGEHVVHCLTSKMGRHDCTKLLSLLLMVWWLEVVLNISEVKQGDQC